MSFGERPLLHFKVPHTFRLSFPAFGYASSIAGFSDEYHILPLYRSLAFPLSLTNFLQRTYNFSHKESPGFPGLSWSSNIYSCIHGGWQPFAVYVPSQTKQDLVFPVSFGRPPVICVSAEYDVVFLLAVLYAENLFDYILLCSIHVCRAFEIIRYSVFHFTFLLRLPACFAETATVSYSASGYTPAYSSARQTVLPA